MDHNSEPLKKFCKAFDAYAEPSPRVFRRVVQSPFDWTDDCSFPKFETEDLKSVAIHIPEFRLRDFLSAFDEQKYLELEIRDRVPAVKRAYEQYRLLLKMCGVDNARY
jgi:hypothetical protein